MIYKAVTVTPSSMVISLVNILSKWLQGRVSIDPGSTEVLAVSIPKFGPKIATLILIISFETFRLVLIFCDEGHGLKNSGSQTYHVLAQLNC